MALYNQEIIREGGERDYHRLRMCVRVYVEQAQRSNKFRIQNEITERGAATKGEGQNSITKRKTRECFQWKTNGSCSKEDSCSFLHTHAAGNHEPVQERVVSAVNLASSIPWETVSKKKREQASPSVPKVTEQTDVRSSGCREARPATRAKIPCLWRAKCKISSCDYRHPPVSRNDKSGNGCIHGHRCQYRHADGEEKPSKRSKKRGYSRNSCCSEGK